MADTLAEIPSTILGLLSPGTSLIIRCISFACLSFGLLLFTPFALLVAGDFFLWIYRHYVHSTSRSTPDSQGVTNIAKSGSSASGMEGLRARRI